MINDSGRSRDEIRVIYIDRQVTGTDASCVVDGPFLTVPSMKHHVIDSLRHQNLIPVGRK
ncbi:hypothetical protein ES702_03615 [subsurface metagenome]